jgi:hypothetical protein
MVLDVAHTGRIEELTGFYHYAVTVPGNWYRIARSEDALRAFLRLDGHPVDPAVETALRNVLESAISLSDAGPILVALRFADDKSPLGPFLTVSAYPNENNEKLDDVANRFAPASSPGADAANFTKTLERLPSGDAIRIESHAHVGSLPLTGVEHIVVAGDTVGFVSCGFPGHAPTVPAECDAIAETFAFLP